MSIWEGKWHGHIDMYFPGFWGVLFMVAGDSVLHILQVSMCSMPRAH